VQTPVPWIGSHFAGALPQTPLVARYKRRVVEEKREKREKEDMTG